LQDFNKGTVVFARRETTAAFLRRVDGPEAATELRLREWVKLRK
jgi:hypothetical protein